MHNHKTVYHITFLFIKPKIKHDHLKAGLLIIFRSRHSLLVSGSSIISEVRILLLCGIQFKRGKSTSAGVQ